ncbi:MAG: outer membrane protein insertion porin family [Candidatus Omnitrophota bacterium]|jgi:outer membrane protein insertion porin family
MTKNKTVLTTLLITMCLTLGFTHSALAEDVKVVSAIEIEGNDTVAQQTILSQIRTVPGRPLNQSLLSEDLKRLYSLGFFRDVQIRQVDDASSQIILRFLVKEKAILGKITIAGNSQIKERAIRDVLRAKTGDFFDEQTIRRDIDSVKKIYEAKGFYDINVTHELEFDDINNQAELIIRVDEGVKVVIKSITFEGMNWFKPAKILKSIETKSRGWYGLISGLLKEDALDIDIQRIRSMYDEEGFSDAKIGHRLDATDEPGQVNLIFEINEGRQYLVGTIDFQGNQLFSNTALISASATKPDSPFSRRGLRQNVSDIQDLYFEKGYMNARIIFDSSFNDETGRVDSIYKITENSITYVNRIKIMGNTKTKDIVIRRELRVYPGEPFNGASLKRSKERLFNLGYFEEVQFDTEDTEKKDHKNLIVSIKEQKTGEFSFGGGFSSIDKALGFVQIRQRNFDHGNYPSFTGAGEDLSVRLQLGTVRSQGELSWTDPWFMGHPFSLGFDLFKRESSRTRSSGLFFDEDRQGGRLRIGKELSDFDIVNASYAYEQVDISDVPDDASADLQAEEGETNVSRLALNLTRDKRDNRFVPTNGYLLSGSSELAGGFLAGDRDFWKMSGLAAGYWPHRGDNVIELKLRGGISDAYDDSEKVPIFERYYAGGANTIRGYKERRVGPRDTGTGDPIGGEAYWVANAEYTFPIVEGVLKAAAFYDIGAVDATIDDFGAGDIAQGIGMGVRIKTPIGPVKIDAGFPINDVEGEDKEVRFYFNMSRGF